MTVIVGVAEKGKVWMGGDSALVGGYSITVKADAKVYVKGDYIFGTCGSPRMHDIIRYHADLPKPPKVVNKRWMVTKFIPAVRTALKEQAHTVVEHNQENFEGSFLVGTRGRLFAVYGDFQIGSARGGSDAAGAGEEFSLGALYATSGMPPAERVKIALEAANRHSGAVCPPYSIRSV